MLACERVNTIIEFNIILDPVLLSCFKLVWCSVNACGPWTQIFLSFVLVLKCMFHLEYESYFCRFFYAEIFLILKYRSCLMLKAVYVCVDINIEVIDEINLKYFICSLYHGFLPEIECCYVNNWLNEGLPRINALCL